MMKDGELTQGDTVIDKAVLTIQDMKKFWYFYRTELGDLLLDTEAQTAMTTTLNNCGLVKKERHLYTEAIKFMKETLDLEKAVYAFYLNK